MADVDKIGPKKDETQTTPAQDRKTPSLPEPETRPPARKIADQTLEGSFVINGIGEVKYSVPLIVYTVENNDSILKIANRPDVRCTKEALILLYGENFQKENKNGRLVPVSPGDRIYVPAGELKEIAKKYVGLEYQITLTAYSSTKGQTDKTPFLTSNQKTLGAKRTVENFSAEAREAISNEENISYEPGKKDPEKGSLIVLYPATEKELQAWLGNKALAPFRDVIRGLYKQAHKDKLEYGTVACNFLPFGAMIKIDGFGEKIFVVRDTLKYDDRVDIWCTKKQEAKILGINNNQGRSARIKITVIGVNDADLFTK